MAALSTAVLVGAALTAGASVYSGMRAEKAQKKASSSALAAEKEKEIAQKKALATQQSSLATGQAAAQTANAKIDAASTVGTGAANTLGESALYKRSLLGG